MIQRSYTQARAELAELMDRAVDDHETVIIERRGRPSVALISADELHGMRETLHLLRSPKNAARLLSALEESRAGRGTREMTVEGLRDQLDLPQAPPARRTKPKTRG